MAGNSVTLTFAGDADQLQRASRQAEQAVERVGGATATAGGDMERAGGGADNLSRQYGDLGSATTGVIDSIDALGGGLQAVADISDYARDQAQKLARANVDVMQATEDMAQSQRDAAQAGLDTEQAAIDLEQAMLDEATALKEYNEAVKEHGKNSDEAKQAKIDMQQASLDVLQAEEDAAQATRDLSQANIDAKTAQVDLNDAMHEANPPELQQWADKVGMVTPLLTALVGVTSLVTAAQWAWNAAQLASPTTWIVLAVIALVAVIVLIATKTDWFQKMWKAAWGWIKDAASAVGSWFKDTLWNKWIRGAWDGIVNKGKSVWAWMRDLPGKLKSAFASVTGFLFAPFRAAFNRIADAWNSTIGRLSWTVPGWVPGVGGNSISAPQLPKFHAGGMAPAGRETLAILQSGEKVSSAASRDGEQLHVVIRLDTDTLIEGLARGVRRRGGNVQFVLGGRNA